MIAVPAQKTTTATPTFRTGDERLIKVTASAALKVGSLLTKQGRANGVLRVAGSEGQHSRGNHRSQ